MNIMAGIDKLPKATGTIRLITLKMGFVNLEILGV